MKMSFKRNILRELDELINEYDDPDDEIKGEVYDVLWDLRYNIEEGYFDG